MPSETRPPSADQNSVPHGKAPPRPAAARRPAPAGRASGSGMTRTVPRRRACAPSSAIRHDHARIVEAKRRGLARVRGHARRSPIRNCSARSRRMWGRAGAPARPARGAAGGSAGSGSRPRRARGQARESRRAANSAAGSSGRSPGNDRDLGLAVEASPPTVSPATGVPMIDGSMLAAARHRRLARRAHGGERDHVDRGAGELRRARSRARPCARGCARAGRG